MYDDGREAILPLTIIGRSGVRAEIDAGVDIGITGSLCLPLDIVRFLSAPFVGRGVAEKAMPRWFFDRLAYLRDLGG